MRPVLLAIHAARVAPLSAAAAGAPSPAPGLGGQTTEQLANLHRQTDGIRQASEQTQQRLARSTRTASANSTQRCVSSTRASRVPTSSPARAQTLERASQLALLQHRLRPICLVCLLRWSRMTSTAFTATGLAARGSCTMRTSCSTGRMRTTPWTQPLGLDLRDYLSGHKPELDKFFAWAVLQPTEIGKAADYSGCLDCAAPEVVSQQLGIDRRIGER